LTWSGGPDGSVEFLNKQWRDYTGLSLEQALGWKWAQTIHPDDLPQLQKLWREILRTGVPTDVEARVRRYDGTYRWFLFRCSALRDGSGSIIRWYGT
ncbi:PAS domain-containing protein, partial [Acinetobacter baumannii]